MKFKQGSLLATSSFVSASGVIYFQLFAMVSLQPSQFGIFSAVYLVFAFGTTLVYCTVLDVWARGFGPSEKIDEFRAGIISIGVLAGITAAIVGYVISDLYTAVLGCLGVWLATCRLGERSRAIRASSLGRILMSDAAFLGMWIAIPLGLSNTGIEWSANSVIAIWCFAAFIALVMLRPSARMNFRGFALLFRSNWTRIKSYLLDSVLLDFGGIGIPILILPILGISDFGLYRAASNVTSPVKLLLDPIRSKFSQTVIRQILWWPFILIIFSLAASFGIIAGVSLVALENMEISLGTLSALSRFALPVGVLVAGTAITGVYYLAVRLAGVPKVLFKGRICSLTFTVALPLSGALLGSLEGAILGLALSSVSNGVLWMALAIGNADSESFNRALS